MINVLTIAAQYERKIERLKPDQAGMALSELSLKIARVIPVVLN